MHNPLTKIDFYKAGHRQQYPEGTTKVYTNGTFRKSRIDGIDHVVFFGMQYVILQYLIREWNEKFFKRPMPEVVNYYQRRMDNALGKGTIPIDHIMELHNLGYLPLEIKALPEGTLVPMRVPAFTITNTKPEFFWLVNYLESVISNKIWKPCTSATLALQFRKNFEHYYQLTVGESFPNNPAVMWQGHDFSYRGMSGDEDACTSGAGHLLSFWGTDTVPAIDFLEDYYFADSDNEMVGGSVPATEHSVMCMGGKEDEIETIRRLITQVYPSGIVSIVSDTWDFWQVVTQFLPALKDDIMNRTGSPIGIDKTVTRPDSGDPYRILVGYFPHEYIKVEEKFYHLNHRGEFDSTNPKNELKIHEIKGLIECLWDTFGGSMSPLGFRMLNPKVGAIYGDSINLVNQLTILEGLMRKGFASTNIVLGIGSFTYEYQTRDTFGFAMKATYGEITEEESWLGETADGLDIESKYGYSITAREIYKDPKTDDGTKKSARGLLKVYEDDNHELKLKDQCTLEEEKEGLLQTVFLNGEIVNTTSLDQIRGRINSYIL